MDAEKYVKDEIDDLKEIKKRPYSYICDYVESIYPNIGYKTFKILALLPCSLIIPDLPLVLKKFVLILIVFFWLVQVQEKQA